MDNPTKPDEVLPVKNEVAPIKNEPVQLAIMEDYKTDTITLRIGENNGLVFTSKQALEFAMSLRQSVHRINKHRLANGMKPIKASNTRRGKR